MSARLRRALGKQADDGEYCETQSGSGYRFVAPVERIQGEISPAGLTVGAVTIDPDGDLRSWAERHRRFLDGRSALERLDRHEVARARRAFEAVLTVNPHDALAHIGLAMAHLLHFESTRADATPDRDVLTLAELHARHACRLDPRAGHAWRTLALVRHRVGDAWEATAAALGVLAACPDLALAHWLAATVYVARRSFDRALDHARAGCVQQDALATARLVLFRHGRELLSTQHLRMAAGDRRVASGVPGVLALRLLGGRFRAVPVHELHDRAACGLLLQGAWVLSELWRAPHGGTRRAPRRPRPPRRSDTLSRLADPGSGLLPGWRGESGWRSREAATCRRPKSGRHRLATWWSPFAPTGS